MNRRSNEMMNAMQKASRHRPAILTFAVAAALAVVAVSPHDARAQAAIERHEPEVPRQAPAPLRIDEQDYGKADTTPLGVDLAGVHLIGKDAAVSQRPPAGITGTLGNADAAQLQVALSPFVGRPLSLSLAGQVQAAIAKVYRDSGYPFVSVTLPPQELTDGVLQVRIIEFNMGRVSVAAADPAQAELAQRGLRVTPGGRIDAGALQEDLDWLNRTPYRRAEGVFQPGEQAALSDLGVNLTTGKSWQVFAGWANNGSEGTGKDRYSLGANAWFPSLNGTIVSYQLTTSDDAWSQGRMTLEGGDYPKYLSHAARIIVPTAPRQQLEIAPGFVATRERANEFFAFESRAFELPVIYRSAISNILPGRYWGDVYGGFEFKSLSRTAYFSDIDIGSGSAKLFQFVLGWNRELADRYGRTSIDARVKYNPGGIASDNNARTWSTFTNGRIDDVTYAYPALDLMRVTTLPHDLNWISSFSGVLANQSLPDTERMSLGGLYAVRGYHFDDVSVDSGFVWRNELRLSGVPVLSRATGVADGVSPFLFADLGSGKDRYTRQRTTLASVGAGLDYDLARYVSTGVTFGYALRDAGLTESGDWNVQARVTLRY